MLYEASKLSLRTSLYQHILHEQVALHTLSVSNAHYSFLAFGGTQSMLRCPVGYAWHCVPIVPSFEAFSSGVLPPSFCTCPFWSFRVFPVNMGAMCHCMLLDLVDCRVSTS